MTSGFYNIYVSTYCTCYAKSLLDILVAVQKLVMQHGSGVREMLGVVEALCFARVL